MSMQSHLQDIGLVQYAQTIQDHGFETWQDLVCITESSLEQIGMLLGHRRKLQRALRLFFAREASRSLVPSPSKQQRQKRRYRRHPKRDQNAPVRPKTAYQVFSGEVRRQMLDDGLSFVELAKVVGKRWATQPADERNTCAWSALKAKLRFQVQSRLYEGTQEYLQYQQYLQAFTNQHNSSSRAQQCSVARDSQMNKRPSEPRREDAIVGSQSMSLQRQLGQITACATDGYTQVGSGERTFAEVDRGEATKCSLPAFDCTNPNRAVSIDGHERDQIRNCASTLTARLHDSQYFRTVLHM